MKILLLSQIIYILILASASFRQNGVKWDLNLLKTGWDRRRLKDFSCMQYITKIRKNSILDDIKMDILCEHIIEELRQEETNAQIEKKREKEESIYRTYLASRVKSSLLRDFLTMRY